ncbi:DEAD-box type RNA helicase, partial [Gonapodya sp. JEL0774]
RGIGFLADTRRLNVAITRAKSSLWIVGRSGSLIQNPVWGSLIVDAKKRGCFAKFDTSAYTLHQVPANLYPDISSSRKPDKGTSSKQPKEKEKQDKDKGKSPSKKRKQSSTDAGSSSKRSKKE